jgi:hypothetical protein
VEKIDIVSEFKAFLVIISALASALLRNGLVKLVQVSARSEINIQTEMLNALLFIDLLAFLVNLNA